MTPQLRVSPFLDPYLNLALESTFLNALDPETSILFLYVDNPCVVMGRFQNPWIETDPRELGKIHLVRRQSGGGTVYHDRGNLNFSFIIPQSHYDKTENLKSICRVLKQTGISLEINERHDLTVYFREKVCKVSGSAYRLKKESAFHHGTLLIHSDLTALGKAIAPPEARQILKSGGTASVRSQVINLNLIKKGLTVEKVIECFRNSFREQQMEWEKLTESPQVIEEVQNLKSEEWLLGKTPPFKQDLSEVVNASPGTVTIEIRKGIIGGAPEKYGFLNGIPYGQSQTEEALKKGLSTFSGSPGRDILFRRIFEVIR